MIGLIYIIKWVNKGVFFRKKEVFFYVYLMLEW